MNMEYYTNSNVRDSRDKFNNLNYLSGDKKFNEIKECVVVNLNDSQNLLCKLKNLK